MFKQALKNYDVEIPAEKYEILNCKGERIAHGVIPRPDLHSDYPFTEE